METERLISQCIVAAQAPGIFTQLQELHHIAKFGEEILTILRSLQTLFRFIEKRSWAVEFL
jgi:hypothetical protein